MRYTLVIVTVMGFTFSVGQAFAGLDVFVYPTKGQTKEQQEQDEFACYKWGKEQTGFDPTQTVQQAAPPQQHGQVEVRGLGQRPLPDHAEDEQQEEVDRKPTDH